MEIVVPLVITDTMLTSSTIDEDDYTEWSETGTVMAPFNAVTLDWTGIAVDSSTSDVYACSSTEVKWSGITVDESTKTVYSCVKGGDIYFRSLGDSYFTALGQTTRDWDDIAVDSSNGFIYACVYAGYIYKRVGVSDFVAVESTTRNWSGLAIDSATNDVYACVYGGYIYKQTAGAGAFVAIFSTALNWTGITIDPVTKNTYACVSGGDVYKRSLGAGDFVAMGQTSRAWAGVSVNSDNGDVYACVSRVGLYIYGTTVYSLGDRVIVTSDHGVYESLADSNVRKNPVTDAVSTNPSWARVGNTNRWKMFDYKTSSQTSSSTSIVDVITPGVKVTSIGLIEVEATQVIVSTTLPTTSTTVDITDEVTDLVIKNALWDTTTVFTVTITNTASAAKCGELLLGTPEDLGFTQYGVEVGIIDHSTKETDIFGTPTLIVREFAKRGNFDVLVENENLNSTYRKLAKYRAVNVLWIGDDNFAPTIIFGWCRKFSVVLPSYGVNKCSLDIEGMT